MFCLQEAFRKAGYNIHVPASVPRQMLPGICQTLGVKITGYLETKDDHFDPVKIQKIVDEINLIPVESPVIVIYTVCGVQGHAEYFGRLCDVPERKKNGIVIHSLK